MSRYVIYNFSSNQVKPSHNSVNTVNNMVAVPPSSIPGDPHSGISGWLKDNWKTLAKGAAAAGAAGLAGYGLGDWLGGMNPDEQTAMLTEPLMRLDNFHDGTTMFEYQTVPASQAYWSTHSPMDPGAYSAKGNWGLKNLVSPDATAVTDVIYDKHGVQVLPEQLTRPNAVSLADTQIKDILGRSNNSLGYQFKSSYSPGNLAQMPADMGNGYWTHAATAGRQEVLPVSKMRYSSAPSVTGIFR